MQIAPGDYGKFKVEDLPFAVGRLVVGGEEFLFNSNGIRIEPSESVTVKDGVLTIKLEDQVSVTDQAAADPPEEPGEKSWTDRLRQR